MSLRRSYVDHLEDIEAIQKAQLFNAGMTLEDFTADEKSLYATVPALEIVGEATKRLPERVRRLQPSVPWRELAGIRAAALAAPARRAKRTRPHWDQSHLRCMPAAHFWSCLRRS